MNDFPNLVYHQSPSNQEKFYVTTDFPKVFIAETISEDYAKLFAQAPKMLKALVALAYGIKTCGHNFTCICNQVKAEAVIAEIEGQKYRNAWELKKTDENS